MSKFLEIEVKYDASDIPIKKFLKVIKKDLGFKVKELKGVDVYYKKGSESIRYRKTKENRELTIKKRKSKNHTTVRTEVNLEIAKHDQDAEVQALMELMGYKKHVTLKKHYYIATFPMGSGLSGIGEIVWYEVKSRGKPTRQFIEIEVRDSSDNKKNLNYLMGKLTSALSELQSKEPMNKSLYEIYK